jgi:hypothetical protein
MPAPGYKRTLDYQAALVALHHIVKQTLIVLNLAMKSFPTAFLALIAPVQAGLRFPCSTLTVQRLDPVVQPGSNPSAHVHHIVGGKKNTCASHSLQIAVVFNLLKNTGNAFNATMTGDVGERATCTTCQMAEDFRCRHIFDCSENLLICVATTGPHSSISRTRPTAPISAYPLFLYSLCLVGRTALQAVSQCTTRNLI